MTSLPKQYSGVLIDIGNTHISFQTIGIGVVARWKWPFRLASCAALVDQFVSVSTAATETWPADLRRRELCVLLSNAVGLLKVGIEEPVFIVIAAIILIITLVFAHYLLFK
jgi:hypothetical protein